MRIACWIPKATETHSEYVILIAFPPQQWLHERSSGLRYTHIVLFQLSGIGVLGVGVWTVVAKHQYVVLLTNATYEVAAWVLIVAGCLVVIVTAVGCVGVLRDNRFFILMVRLPDQYLVWPFVM
jgi:hypothetical protein